MLGRPERCKEQNKESEDIGVIGFVRGLICFDLYTYSRGVVNVCDIGVWCNVACNSSILLAMVSSFIVCITSIITQEMPQPHLNGDRQETISITRYHSLRSPWES